MDANRIKLVFSHITGGFLLLSFLCCILGTAGLAFGEASETKPIAKPALDVLRSHLLFSEALTIISASGDRAASKTFFQSHDDRFKFLTTQDQPPLVLDGYSVQDPSSPIIGYSLFYAGAGGPLAFLYASVNPLVKNAISKADDLIRYSLDSESSPSGGTLYFLGTYDLNSDWILKILVRKDQTPGGLDYNIGYIVQKKSAISGTRPTKERKSSFWRFFVGLFIASFIFPFIYGLILMPLMGLIAVLFRGQADEGKVSALISYPVMVVGFLVNVYILSGWSAYVASRASAYSSAPDVTHSWVYYIVGFFLCHGPLGWMASKEDRDGSFGRMIHIGIAMVMYILFSIWPILMEWPYGWFLTWIYG